MIGKDAATQSRIVLSQRDEFEITRVEEDLDALVSPNLDPYDLIVFYYTVGEISDAQKNGLLNHVASGKGICRCPFGSRFVPWMPRVSFNGRRLFCYTPALPRLSSQHC